MGRHIRMAQALSVAGMFKVSLWTNVEMHGHKH